MLETTGDKVSFCCPELDDTIFGDSWSDDREVFLSKRELKQLRKMSGVSERV